jgi:cell division protein ZapA
MSVDINHAHKTTVVIDGKSYEINCPPEKVSELHASASLLENKIRDIRDNHGNSLPTDRVVMITALNMAHEQLQQQNQLDTMLSNTNNILSE